MSTKEINQSIPAEERFRLRVEKTDTCWLWTGSLRGGHRYAVFMVDGVSVMAHRWSYEHFVGPIPAGMQIDHMCGVTRCVNPEHLRPLTPSQNVQAHWREQRGVCRNGHPMVPENVVWRSGGKQRRCRTCDRARMARYEAKIRGGGK